MSASRSPHPSPVQPGRTGANSSAWCLIPSRDAPTASPRARAALLAVGDGTIAAVGDLGDDPGSALTLVTGAFGTDDEGAVRPVVAPVWTHTDGPGDDAEADPPPAWVLDMRHGILVAGDPDVATGASRFVSLARPGVGVLRVVRDTPTTWAPPLALHDVRHALAAAATTSIREASDAVLVAETRSDRCAFTTAVAERRSQRASRHVLERIVAVGIGDDAAGAARAALDDARDVGFDELRREHVDEWRRRWDAADISIDGDEGSQRAVRFALFHLLSCAGTSGASAVGARGLTGLSYAGHVFWDTDVFVLPVLAATLPAAARSVLEYRLRRLPAARARAASEQRPGARFPWESADSGDEVTPPEAIDLDGATVPILTGSHAVHIGSDIAWSAQHYVDWTADAAFAETAGRELVVETARYLASRVRTDDRGIAHLDGVVGPDEYHGVVDDNSYSNRMLRWHLARAAELVEVADGPTAERFSGLSAALTVGYDPRTHRHEQFAGFHALDDVRIADLVDVPVAADVLLGRDRIRRSTVVKQPDVLMAHHLLGDGPDGSLAADLEYYLPRTAHGSSLSPAVCASLLARAGRPDDAIRWFDLAARLDLDDLTRTTGGGLHLATMGGLWQAVAWGFAGIRPTADGLVIDPALPSRWRSLQVRVSFQGVPVRIGIDDDSVAVDCEQPVHVVVEGRRAVGPIELRRRPRERSA